MSIFYAMRTGLLNMKTYKEQTISGEYPPGIYILLAMLDTRQQAQNGVTKPHVTELRPNYSFSSHKNEILSQSIRNLLISIN